MTIAEALSTIKAVKASQYEDCMLVRWLSELDGRVWEDVLSPYAACPCPTLPYAEDEGKRDLLIPFPHDDLYIKWLSARIDYHNGEIVRYENAMALFNEQLDAYMSACVREGMPRRTVRIAL
ncbi:MAG: hypothetical protein RSC91_11505 [Clostridia bacterium]